MELAPKFIRGQGPTVGPPKSVAAHRTVVIPGTAAEILTAHMDTYADDEPDSLIVTSVKGSPLLNRYFAPYGNA